MFRKVLFPCRYMSRIKGPLFCVTDIAAVEK